MLKFSQNSFFRRNIVFEGKQRIYENIQVYSISDMESSILINYWTYMCWSCPLRLVLWYRTENRSLSAESFSLKDRPWFFPNKKAAYKSDGKLVGLERQMTLLCHESRFTSHALHMKKGCKFRFSVISVKSQVFLCLTLCSTFTDSISGICISFEWDQTQKDFKNQD
jgi:hypothetical protein